jgi:hypothetical protein
MFAVLIGLKLIGLKPSNAVCRCGGWWESDASVRLRVSPVELTAPLFRRRVTVNRVNLPQLSRPPVDQVDWVKCPVAVAIVLRRPGKARPVTGLVRRRGTMKELWPKPN